MSGMFLALSRKGAQIPLAAFSFAAALALILTAVFASGVLDRPLALAIALLLVLNGAARLVLWRNTAQTG
jgi:hypothetical protein